MAIETNAAGNPKWVLCPQNHGGNKRYSRLCAGYWQCGSCNCDVSDEYVAAKQAAARAGETREELGAWRAAGVV
jgi:hypothetical protein